MANTDDPVIVAMADLTRGKDVASLAQGIVHWLPPLHLYPAPQTVHAVRAQKPFSSGPPEVKLPGGHARQEVLPPSVPDEKYLSSPHARHPVPFSLPSSS